MQYNKVIVNGTTYMDISSDTVTTDSLLSGYTAHDKNGAQITGTAEPGTGGVTCTARSGGGSWQNAINGSGTSVGWREEKLSDGRLTRWCWDYWNANAGDGNKTVPMTANASDGSGPTAFVGTPQFSFGFINNNTTIACNATVKTWSNSSVTYYLVFTNNTSGRRIAVSLKMEGWWK